MSAAPLPSLAEAAAELTAPGQPYELIDALRNGHPVRQFKNAPESLRALYASTASDLPFLAYADERWTFAEAHRDAARIAQVLVQRCGVAKGDRVAIAMRNWPEWVLGFTAITAIGAVAVAVNAHWLADELAYGLRDCGATVVLADAERIARLAQGWQADDRVEGLRVLAVRMPADRLADARSACGYELIDLHAAMAAVAPAGAAVAMPEVAVAPDDPAIMLYTSGSTGRPKGVPSTQRMVLSALLSWELDRLIGARITGIALPEPAEQPGTLLAVPLFHVTGLHASYLVSYRLQRRMVAMYRWDPAEAARLIAQHRLTSMVGPAAITGDLVREAEKGGHDLSMLISVGGGGAPRAPEQVRQIKAGIASALPATGWGMTETNAIGTGIAGEDYLSRPTSSGRCSQVLQIRVVDADGHELPAGERGELQVRGTSVFTGYWHRPEADAQAFVPGTDWFRTGDGALIDADGYLHIVDRIKDLIIRGGENIGCGTVEAALLMFPGVHEACAFAVPDERLGEEVGCTVHGPAPLDEVALRAFLRQHLAGFEQPRHILQSAEPLARTATGKILKRQIRAAALRQLGLSSA